MIKLQLSQHFCRTTKIFCHATQILCHVGVTSCCNIIHLLDSAEPDIRFAVQIEADIERSEAESNINLDLHNKSNVRRGSVQQMFYYAEITK